MFIKVTASGGHRYARLVQALRNADGQPRQRTVATLGRVDECGGQRYALLAGLLRAKGRGVREGDAPQLRFESALALGDVWVLDALGIARAALVGHSWGSLIALEAAARLGARASHLVLVGTAFPMKVSPALIESALNEPEKALHMVNVFSRSTLAPPLGAGQWVYGAAWPWAGACCAATRPALAKLPRATAGLRIKVTGRMQTFESSGTISTA